MSVQELKRKENQNELAVDTAPKIVCVCVYTKTSQVKILERKNTINEMNAWYV